MRQRTDEEGLQLGIVGLRIKSFRVAFFFHYFDVVFHVPPMHTSNVNRKDYPCKESHHHVIIEQSLCVIINYIQSPRWTRWSGTRLVVFIHASVLTTDISHSDASFTRNIFDPSSAPSFDNLLV